MAYIVGGWALSQGIASKCFQFFDVPNWAIRLVVLLIIIGFPIALIIAWAFEVTPEGIKRTEAADAAGQRSRGVAWIYVVLIGAALSVGLFFVGRYTAGTTAERLKEWVAAERGGHNRSRQIDRGAPIDQRKRRSEGRIFFRWIVGRTDRSSRSD